MIFPRIQTTGFALIVVGMLARPGCSAAATVQQRQESNATDMLAIINALKSNTGFILPQINNLINNNSSTEGNLNPLLFQLVTALQTSATSFNTLKRDTASSKQDIANTIAEIYTDISMSLVNLRTKNPRLYSLIPLSGLDTSLIQVLLGIEFVTGGVLALIAVAMNAAGGLTSGLGLVLTLTLIALL